MFQSVLSSMNKLLIFGLIGLAFFLFDLYAWQALKTISIQWSKKSRLFLYYLYWGLSLSYVFLMVMRPYFQLEKTGSGILMLFQVFGVILFIAKLFVVIPLLVEDMYRGVSWLVQKWNGQGMSRRGADIEMQDRRKFISQSALILGAVPVLTMSFGLFYGAHQYRVRRKTLYFSDLPSSFDGLRILQLSDIHSGSFWNRSAVIRGVQMANDLKPDLIVFTGDLVNNTASEMDKWVDVFKELEAPFGVYSVLGNHDYGDYVSWESVEEKRANLDRLMEIQRQMGWQLLNNASVYLTKNGEQISLTGVENWSAKGNFPKYGRLEEALEQAKESDFRILLSHDPSHWKAEVLTSEKIIHLTLSGHTHGFQFGIETHGLKWSPVKYLYPEWAGLYRKDDRYLYVNRGFGYIGYPGRLGIDPEITILTLKKSS
jgi:predicted MPP superfamily phosphohydrolase